MLAMVRYINLILLLILFMALIFAVVILSKRFFSGNQQTKSKKGKSGELPSDAGVRDLLLDDRVDEAIELYRRFTGVDLFTAQVKVEQMAREIRLGVQYKQYQRLLKKEGKAVAIETYQQETGADLAEALDYIENIEKQ